MNKPTVAALCCTHGRYKCLQRSVRCFLDQDYEGDAIMFIYNSGDSLFIEGGNYAIITDDYSEGIIEYPELHKTIFICNLSKDSYKNVGEKYNKALNRMLEVFPNIGIVYSHDDDDIYLPNHITEGVKGMMKSYNLSMKAYKPKYSYFRSREGMIRNENTYEPSIFVDAKYLQEKGYAQVSVKYHQQWLDPLVINKQIFVDPNGKSTFIYNWGDTWDTYKMSGTGDDSDRNTTSHKLRSLDMGEGVLTPTIDNLSYYDEIKLLK